MAADVVSVLAQLYVQQFHVLGSSLGAGVRLSLAANHPDLVESRQVANIPEAVQAHGWLLDPQPVFQAVLDFLSQK